MKALLLTFLLFFIYASSLKAQLKEFEISPLPKPEISLVQANTEFGEDALIIIYSSLTNLNFRSSMGMIDKQSYNPQSNRYEVLVRPIKQILLVYSNGFMEGTISTINPQSKDVFYFKVEEKATKLLNQTLPGKLTINSNPSGANISLNGIPISTKTPFTGNLNPGPTSIQLSKTKYQIFDTLLNIESTINEVLTINLKPSTLWLNINSNPTSAQVELDDINIGTTPLSKELDLTDKSKQGPRLLKITLPDYADQNQTIQVYPSKEPLIINYELKKLEGSFKIESNPMGAEVFINGIYKGISPLQGVLPVGTYQIELKMEDYEPSSKKQIIVNTLTTTSLNENLILRKDLSGNLENDSDELEPLDDASGNSYKTVRIGDQVWMAENLKTTQYSNGDLIPNIHENTEWMKLEKGGWSIQDNLPQNNTIFGKLYNWYAVADKRNVCPNGWHIPKNSEWSILNNYLGGKSFAINKMKDAGLDYWESPNTNATNESGFSGLPGGYRSSIGLFYYLGGNGYWWSSTEDSFDYSWCRDLVENGDNEDGLQLGYKQNGFSIRCIKD